MLPYQEPLGIPHKRTVLSKPAVNKCAPSGLNTTEVNGAVWPLSTAIRTPRLTSQIHTLPSRLAVARSVPSGLNESADTELGSPLSVLMTSPVSELKSHTLPS